MRIVVPYSKEVLDSVIYEYQEFFWPFQFVFILLSLWIVYLLWKDENKNHKIIVSILGFYWIWNALVYELNYYNDINWIGSYVACFFVFQALLLLWFGVFKEKIEFVKNRFSSILALALVVCYPLFQLIKGTHHFEISIIGMLPDITVVFSLIILFMNTQKKVTLLFIIPIIWSVFSLYWNYLILFK